jgi:hypothetical protein
MHRYMQQHVEERSISGWMRVRGTNQNEYTKVGHVLQHTPAVCRSVL